MKLLRTQWDRCAAVAAVVVGLLALLIGWIGVSGTEFLAEQMSYVASGGLFGIFALGVGAALWLSADLRDEWRKLDSVEHLLAEALDRSHEVVAASLPAAPQPAPLATAVQEPAAEPGAPTVGRRAPRRLAKPAPGQ
ncbi:MAG: hypothetical protein JWN87_1347 [Frankiales bacterium]|jgi:hypothetical protein|nr:hypothetical protein [Frankiales bacterium]